MIRIYPAGGGYAAFKIEGKHVYGSDGGYPLYYIEGAYIYDKNYCLTYRIDGDYIYKSMERYPEYRIDGENIYSGNGGCAIYRIDYGNKGAETTNDPVVTGSNSSSGRAGGYYGGGASSLESIDSFALIVGIILGLLSICVLVISGPELFTILLQPRLLLLYMGGAFIISWISFAGNGTLKGTIIGTLVLIAILFECFAVAGEGDLGTSGVISRFLMWIILKAVLIIVMGILSIPFGMAIGAMAYGFTSFYRFLHERKKLRWLFVILVILSLVAVLFVRYKWTFNKTIGLLKSGDYEEATQIMDEIPFFNKFAIIAGDDKEITYVRAKSLIENGEFEEAGEILYDIRDYKDSQELIGRYGIENTDKFAYEEAVLLYNDGNYITALEAFCNLGEYKDSEEFTKNSAFKYLLGTWVNEEIERFIVVSEDTGRLNSYYNKNFYYGGTDTVSQTTRNGTKYDIMSYEFGYDDNGAIAFNLIIRKPDGTNQTVSVRDLQDTTCKIIGIGSFSRTDKQYNY